VNGTFLEDTHITIGIQLHAKEVSVDNEKVLLQIWDLGGEERFRFILPQYCIGASGGIFMYDLTSPHTLFHLKEWMEVIKEAEADLPIIVAGTKADLVPYRKVYPGEVIELASKFGITETIEVSSKTGDNVEELFEMIARQMIGYCSANISQPVPLQTKSN